MHCMLCCDQLVVRLGIVHLTFCKMSPTGVEPVTFCGLMYATCKADAITTTPGGLQHMRGASWSLIICPCAGFGARVSGKFLAFDAGG